MKERPLILVTNDDGIQAKGISELVTIALKYGNVIVVAPDGPRSAQSSALTINMPIAVKLVYKDDNLTKYAITGTPTDCVKLAIDQLITEMPDLVLSGINHGSNSSINVIYSGTMGAAMEGALHGIPSIGLSLCDHSSDADFENCIVYFEKIIAQALKNPMPSDTCLNVNAPVGEIKGTKVCVQAEGRWVNEFQEYEAPRSEKFFWLIGNCEYNNNILKPNELTDQQALDNQYISIVPIHVDMTAHHIINQLSNYEMV